MKDTKTKEKPLVLIIEDDPLLTKMYRAKFASEGFRVMVADDGEKGLAAALEKKPQVMVLDIMMPKLSGTDMLGKLRKDINSRGVIAIVLSNLSSEEEMKKARELGVKEYLLKANYTPKEVVEKVKKYIK